MAASGELPLETWAETLPVEEIVERLGAIRGIGPWTINYALLRGFGWLDGSLHGDVAVRHGVQTLLGLPDKPNEEQVRLWLAPFSPWRALIAAHLWAARTGTAV
jgi:DNA-3-methyladenine glycosylase II